MNRRSIHYPGIVLGALVLGCLGTFARSGAADADHSLILLNGKPMEYSTFTIGSRGKLALITISPDATQLPFRIYLKRGGTVINSTESNPNRAVTEVEIANVLAVARHGDNLIVEPVHQSEAKSKRVFRVVNYITMPIFNWLYRPKNATDGC